MISGLNIPSLPLEEPELNSFLATLNSIKNNSDLSGFANDIQKNFRNLKPYLKTLDLPKDLVLAIENILSKKLLDIKKEELDFINALVFNFLQFQIHVLQLRKPGEENAPLKTSDLLALAAKFPLTGDDLQAEEFKKKHPQYKVVITTYPKMLQSYFPEKETTLPSSGHNSPDPFRGDLSQIDLQRDTSRHPAPDSNRQQRGGIDSKHSESKVVAVLSNAAFVDTSMQGGGINSKRSKPKVIPVLPNAATRQLAENTKKLNEQAAAQTVSKSIKKVLWGAFLFVVGIAFVPLTGGLSLIVSGVGIGLFVDGATDKAPVVRNKPLTVLPPPSKQLVNTAPLNPLSDSDSPHIPVPPNSPLVPSPLKPSSTGITIGLQRAQCKARSNSDIPDSLRAQILADADKAADENYAEIDSRKYLHIPPTTSVRQQRAQTMTAATTSAVVKLSP